MLEKQRKLFQSGTNLWGGIGRKRPLHPYSNSTPLQRMCSIFPFFIKHLAINLQMANNFLFIYWFGNHKKGIICLMASE